MIIDYKSRGGHHSGVQRSDTADLRRLYRLFLDFHKDGILPLSGRADFPDDSAVKDIAARGGVSKKWLDDLVASYGGYEGLVWVFKTFRRMRPQMAKMLEDYSSRGCARDKGAARSLAAEYGLDAAQFSKQTEHAAAILARAVYLRRHNGEMISESFIV